MDYRDLLKWLKRNGYQLQTTGGNHLQVIRDGSKLYTMPVTPSDSRAARNAIAGLRRVGVPIPRK